MESEPGSVGPRTSATGAEVRSVRLDQYKKLMAGLPEKVGQAAEDLYQNYFSKDPKHPFLKGKWVPDRQRRIQVWRVDITRFYRALAWVEETSVGDVKAITYVWYWCGSHEDYNRLVGT